MTGFPPDAQLQPAQAQGGEHTPTLINTKLVAPMFERIYMAKHVLMVARTRGHTLKVVCEDKTVIATTKTTQNTKLMD